MQATRRARLQSVILEELSMVVPREVKDPRIPLVTFTRCEVTDDGSQATVWVTLLGSLAQEPSSDPVQAEAHEKLHRQKVTACLDGLTSASGYLRRHLGGVLDLRHSPKLVFREDQLRLRSSLTYAVDRAGVFELKFNQFIDYKSIHYVTAGSGSWRIESSHFHCVNFFYEDFFKKRKIITLN
jgi:ribosome-binding factor A